MLRARDGGGACAGSRKRRPFWQILQVPSQWGVVRECKLGSTQGPTEEKYSELVGKGYPFGLQKLEAKGFRCFRVEVIYTEKMITLSNVSLEMGFTGA